MNVPCKFLCANMILIARDLYTFFVNNLFSSQRFDLHNVLVQVICSIINDRLLTTWGSYLASGCRVLLLCWGPITLLKITPTNTYEPIYQYIDLNIKSSNFFKNQRIFFSQIYLLIMYLNMLGKWYSNNDLHYVIDDTQIFFTKRPR